MLVGYVVCVYACVCAWVRMCVCVCLHVHVCAWTYVSIDITLLCIIDRAFEKEQRETFSRLCNKVHKETGLIVRYEVNVQRTQLYFNNTATLLHMEQVGMH